MPELVLEELEAQIKQLSELCESLAREKETLQQKQDQWLTERARLVEKGELTRGKLEGILQRLKTLEKCA